MMSIGKRRLFESILREAETSVDNMTAHRALKNDLCATFLKYGTVPNENVCIDAMMPVMQKLGYKSAIARELLENLVYSYGIDKESFNEWFDCLPPADSYIRESSIKRRSRDSFLREGGSKVITADDLADAPSRMSAIKNGGARAAKHLNAAKNASTLRNYDNALRNAKNTEEIVRMMKDLNVSMSDLRDYMNNVNNMF